MGIVIIYISIVTFVIMQLYTKKHRRLHSPPALMRVEKILNEEMKIYVCLGEMMFAHAFHHSKQWMKREKPARGLALSHILE
jgi:hypothetical protein